MTFSLVARCARTGQFGVAAATAMPAVGKFVTHAAPGCGAVATQARVNPYLGIDGVRYLEAGLSASEVRDLLIGQDPKIESRQFAVIGRTGQAVAFTGKECLDWSGSLQGPDFSVQGNRLTGEQVLLAAAAAMERTAEAPLAERLLEALAAGDTEGGDRKGEFSATVYVVGAEEYPLWDIRVDDHPEPFRELRRLHKVFEERLLPEIRKMPTRANPAGESGEQSV